MREPSFAPTPPEARPKHEQNDSHGHRKTPSPPRMTQPTLFELRFGPRRTRIPTSKSSAESKTRPSDTRVSVSRSESIKDELEEDERNRNVKKRKLSDSDYTTDSVAPRFGHRGPFLPVTRTDFCSKYRVDGLPDAEIFYKPDWIDRRTAERWRRELAALPEWYRPTLKVYGRDIVQSREIAAYATSPGLDLKYSGHPVEMHSPFPPILNHIASLLSSDDCLGSEVRFNHCMLNRYDDGSIHIGKHSDNIENKVIVTVSLGADRSWIMERKAPRGQKVDKDEKIRRRWTLKGGSLLVMQGATQKHYTHEIPKELKIKEPRISITFRQLVYN